jgi:hypothetical protein
MENVSIYNNGIKFLLVLIDIFVCKTTKRQKSVTVMEALKTIFKDQRLLDLTKEENSNPT